MTGCVLPRVFGLEEGQKASDFDLFGEEHKRVGEGEGGKKGRAVLSQN